MMQTPLATLTSGADRNRASSGSTHSKLLEPPVEQALYRPDRRGTLAPAALGGTALMTSSIPTEALLDSRLAQGGRRILSTTKSNAFILHWDLRYQSLDKYGQHLVFRSET